MWWSNKINGLHRNDFICASKTDDLYKENKAIIDVASEETGMGKAELEKLLDPSKLTKGGLSG